MDSDDDYLSLSPPKDQSPQVHYRRLKRLKKSSPKTSDDPLRVPTDDPLFLPHDDFARLEALENGTATPDSCSDDLDSNEEVMLARQSLSQGFDDASEMGNGDGIESGPVKEVKKTRRVLEFDDDVAGGGDAEEGCGGFELGKNETRRIGEEDMLGEGDNITTYKKKKTKKRGNSDDGVELQNNFRGTSKRREEKERKAYLQELHAESQRLLRETRDASFKPIPVVQKPISSVLEKIRKRKLEMSKKSMIVNDQNYGYVGNVTPKDRLGDPEVSYEEREKETLETLVEKENVAPPYEELSNLDPSCMDELKDTAKQAITENDQQQVSPVEIPTSAFRAPVHDTEDLFDDSEPNGSTAIAIDEPNSPLVEDVSPSLLALNLKFDSAPIDDSTSDEDDNDKENVDPHPHGITGGSSSPKGEFAKDFIDDEAEEEDNSDNDLSRFQENEEAEDVEDFVELNDMIASGYEERSIDNEKRNELHQRWLEQQDAVGTNKLMQRLNCGLALRDAMLLDKEPEIDEDGQELDDDDDDDDEDDEAKGESRPWNSARIHTKKAKQIILQMLTDKSDAYVSDDEDSQRQHARCFLSRKEGQTTGVSHAEDESSREVFGLIKKLNIVPDNKKKPSALSFFDSVLMGGNSNNSSKSSFLGRVSNHSIPSSHKQGSGAVRSFIFGRDDSNSRSSMSISEDSSDTVSQEARPTRTLTAKYSSTQTKFTSQNQQSALETSSRTSLLDILKQSSSRPQACNPDTTVDLMKGIFAFRASKNPSKLQGRS